MNYRHGFHAGNHTEILKHATLVALLRHLLKKESAFAVLDTHAGAGLHDLRSEPATRTGEADAGILRLGRSVLHEPSLSDFMQLVRSFNESDEIALYPGSPAIIGALLRSQDRLVACELHPDEASRLRALFKGHPRIAVHHRDGYEAIKAFLPPRQGRGLTLIDPPYEQRDEYDLLADAFEVAGRRWPAGIVIGWYPVKDYAKVEELSKSVVDASRPGVLRVELLVKPMDGTTLAGGGLLIANPPWQFDTLLRSLAATAADALAGERGSWRVEWLSLPR